MLVGQQTTLPGRMSWWKWPSIPHLMGVSWVQGMALGSPVVPEEKRTLVRAVGLGRARSEGGCPAEEIGPEEIAVAQQG